MRLGVLITAADSASACRNAFFGGRDISLKSLPNAVVQASIPTGVICTDINTGDASAFRTLVRVFSNFQRAFSQPLKDALSSMFLDFTGNCCGTAPFEPSL